MRNAYNLSHLAHLAGHIGRLQTISVIPVIPGDSLQLSIDGIFRTAPTRKEIVSECQIDICAFYVKHRHCYGDDDWIELIGSGLQLDLPVPVGYTANADSRDPFYLGIKQCGTTVNRALVEGINRIYQRYFAVPSTDTNGTWAFANTAFYPNGTTSDLRNTRHFGPRAARLPHILNGGTPVNVTTGADGRVVRNYTDDDWGVEIPQDTPSIGTAL